MTYKTEITAIEYWLVKGKYKAKAVQLKHNESIVGRNIVAVLGGMHSVALCCDWCDSLRRRCQSRRSA